MQNINFILLSRFFLIRLHHNNCICHRIFCSTLRKDKQRNHKKVLKRNRREILSTTSTMSGLQFHSRSAWEDVIEPSWAIDHNSSSRRTQSKPPKPLPHLSPIQKTPGTISCICRTCNICRIYHICHKTYNLLEYSSYYILV
jgi:hypothetical protein